MPRLQIIDFINEYFALKIRLVRGQQPTKDLLWDAAHFPQVSFMKTTDNNENKKVEKKKVKIKRFQKENKKIRFSYGDLL